MTQINSISDIIWKIDAVIVVSEVSLYLLIAPRHGHPNNIAGNDIILPYHINNDEISEYTTQIPYNYEKLEDIAKAYQTDVESLRQLNPENIAKVDGNSYAFIGDTINVPTFKDYQYGTQKTK